MNLPAQVFQAKQQTTLPDRGATDASFDEMIDFDSINKHQAVKNKTYI